MSYYTDVLTQIQDIIPAEWIVSKRKQKHMSFGSSTLTDYRVIDVQGGISITVWETYTSMYESSNTQYYTFHVSLSFNGKEEFHRVYGSVKYGIKAVKDYIEDPLVFVLKHS